ncbi:MAG: PEP/pyruvate-binding domain-containing protein [Desulfobaccales bacterium]|nr:PEP/pyruvate-binding domain-containing protein [Desulfobaccales bacterium]
MANLFQRLKQIFSKGPPAPPLSLEELRGVFKVKYHAFKLLLAANNTALQLMTDMEAALHGNHSFGMTFVRSHATAVCVNVFAIIKYLNELSGNRYRALEPVFAGIERKIAQTLEHRQTRVIQELVLPLDQVHKEMADGVGSKMANLGEISTQVRGFAVPPGFVITAAAYDLFLSHNQLQEEINRRLQSLEIDDIADLYRQSSEVQMLIIGADLPPALEEAMAQAFQDLAAKAGGPVKVALRSSAIGEDAQDTSFAGQYRSELNVSRENIFTVYKEILAGKYALTAVSYRLHKGLRDEDVPMCVGCMAMVEAVAGGVMYSRDPTDIRSDAVFINAVHGLAKSVVDGSVTPDLWVVSRGDPPAIIKKEVRDKELKVVCLPGEGVYLESDDRGQEAALSDAQALALASIALTLEDHFKTPQDIEWSIDRDGRIFILQSRPLKQLAAPAREGAALFCATENPVLIKGGDLASSGVAAGPVYLVKNNLDLLQFPEGAVLVTAFPHPAWATLLSRAAAVLTDRGGITGHLANVAREFHLPALFNLGDATEWLKPGTVVTVDADGHTVYQGRVESLLQMATAPKGLMKGTPVHDNLKEVMGFITPLNLTDPESREFRPDRCRTLHDITRFAHEVSVKEMFAFDKHKAVAKYFIKRLITTFPMQWWVLNLEDGFKEEVAGKEVELNNIVSVPMLALWEGISTVPWEGPPPVDTKGFMSIVMGAATDPNLATAGGTIFGNQNYFMISKDFCNLTSRLGFHFSTVEALVGDMSFENYLRFAFKGGAADYPRRVLRAKFVGNILEQHHFKVDVKEDSLFARLEGEERDYMLSRLRILGYLTIHTRQLDMIMLNDADVDYYQQKITQDLEKYILPLGAAKD